MPKTLGQSNLAQKTPIESLTLRLITCCITNDYGQFNDLRRMNLSPQSDIKPLTYKVDWGIISSSVYAISLIEIDLNVSSYVEFGHNDEDSKPSFLSVLRKHILWWYRFCRVPILEHCR